MTNSYLAAPGRSAREKASSPSFLRALLTSRLAKCFAALAMVGAVSSAAHAQIAIAYSEAASGDLSNSGLTPTSLSLSAGSNLVLGTTGRVTAVDRDYFTVTVPVGWALDAIFELPGTQAGGVSFFGIQPGSQVTLPVTTATAAGLLGWTHYAATGTMVDLFPLLEIASNGSTGFSAPIGAGTYSFWVQDFTAGTYSYGFDLHLSPAPASPVPEPSTYAAAGGALLLALALRRRFAKSAQPVAVAPSA